MASIFVTNEYDADVKVCKVDSYDADLAVYVVDYESDARGRDELWFYVDWANDATVKICWVDWANDADIKVCFVDYQGDAGWKCGHPWQARLG